MPKKNNIEYIKQYNKANYKTLSTLIPIDLYKNWDNVLRENKIKKRQFLIDCIENYLRGVENGD